MPTASVTSPMMPPSASTSRTRCPFAMPPTAGLHDICAIKSTLSVNRAVRRPMRAEAIAASHPAWPAPTTTTSYCSLKFTLLAIGSLALSRSGALAPEGSLYTILSRVAGWGACASRVLQKMRRMLDFIREFKFGRPQQFAALLLLGFIALALHSALKPHYYTTTSQARLVAGPLPPITSGVVISMLGTSFLTSLNALGIQDNATRVAYLYPFLNVAMVGFGLSLAGALWWVTRRLYNDSGGYVALALFCFSLPMVFYSSRVSPDIIAGWGLYGLIYTAIGVAHTLYAPPRKWRPRILLLGTALGVTAGAYFAAAMVGLVLAGGFMLYLAPGRRKQSIGIVAISCVIALLWLFVFYGFDLHALLQALGAREAWAIGLRHMGPVVPGVQRRLMQLLFAIALITYIAWKRTRYFGNTAPLISCFVLHLIGHDGAQAAIWALPFVFTFIGGIFADLLETRRRRLVSWALLGSGAVYAALAVTAVFTLG